MVGQHPTLRLENFESAIAKCTIDSIIIHYLITFKIDWLDFWFKLVRDSDRDRDCVSYLDIPLCLFSRRTVSR